MRNGYNPDPDPDPFSGASIREISHRLRAKRMLCIHCVQGGSGTEYEFGLLDGSYEEKTFFPVESFQSVYSIFI
jgi:hypothetical protein